LSRNDLSFLDLDGCFSLRSAFASICRIRSRVTENCWPTSSSVWSVFHAGCRSASAARVLARRGRDASTGWWFRQIGLGSRRRWGGRVLSSMKSPDANLPRRRGVRGRAAPLRFSGPCGPSPGACRAFRRVLPGSARGRSRQHLARGAHDLVDVSIMHGNADGAGLVGDRTRDACRIHQVA